MKDYSDIIGYPHYELRKHPRMLLEARAAQFAPFAALSGYSDDVIEAGRETMTSKILTEDRKDILDRKIQMIEEVIEEHPQVHISYFSPDKRKEGGHYQEVMGNIKQIDFLHKTIILMNQITIQIHSILDIQADCIHDIMK